MKGATLAVATRLDFSGTVNGADSWVRPGPGEAVAALTDTLVTFVRGHDLMMNALHPEPRFGPLQLVGPATFEGVPAIRLNGMDELGVRVLDHGYRNGCEGGNRGLRSPARRGEVNGF
jgi:hypothetical protein